MTARPELRSAAEDAERWMVEATSLDRWERDSLRESLAALIESRDAAVRAETMVREEHFCGGAHAVSWPGIKGCTMCVLDAARAKVKLLSSSLVSARSLGEQSQQYAREANRLREAMDATLIQRTTERDAARAGSAALHSSHDAALEGLAQLREELGIARAEVARLTSERDEARAECRDAETVIAMRTESMRLDLVACHAAASSLIPRADLETMVDDLEAAQAEVERLRAESRRFYSADGTFVEMEPHEVVQQRIACAVELDSLRADVARLTAEVSWLSGERSSVLAGRTELQDKIERLTRDRDELVGGMDRDMAAFNALRAALAKLIAAGDEMVSRIEFYQSCYASLCEAYGRATPYNMSVEGQVTVAAVDGWKAARALMEG